jgi:glycine dehydrogenase subunit 2
MTNDIMEYRYTNGKPNIRQFRQAKWDEPIIYELSNPGERGVLLPAVEDEIQTTVGDALSALPAKMRRKEPPKLPEIAQNRVLRHYMRLSQETLGADVNIEIGQGTTTMKYNPKINEHLARSEKITKLHPLQPVETVQGILEIVYKFEQILKEISGMGRVSLQPASGSQALMTNAQIIRVYHESRGDSCRNEIITSIYSHPSNAATAKTAGFNVITLYPDPEKGYPTVDALKAVVSEHTAGLMITNPEDTGIFNPEISEFVKIIHDAGGLCAYDQANANGILGKVRAADVGFDLCHFNLHKTFATPHGSGGPGVGASCVSQDLERFLPMPVIEFDGQRYYLDSERPDSIGKVRSFMGVVPVVLKAYMWVMSLGAKGLKEVAEIAVLNNNYLLKKMLEIPGVSAPYAKGRHRIEQVRYSLEELVDATGVHTEDFLNRAADFGIHYWFSHHPYIVPEPCTLEPTESTSKRELDEYVSIMRQIADEAHSNPELVKTAPHNSTVHQIDPTALEDPNRWAMTWRGYRRKIKSMKNA